jgi:hypothetical protein
MSPLKSRNFYRFDEFFGGETCILEKIAQNWPVNGLCLGKRGSRESGMVLDLSYNLAPAGDA